MWRRCIDFVLKRADDYMTLSLQVKGGLYLDYELILIGPFFNFDSSRASVLESDGNLVIVMKYKFQTWT